jgi:hypothetical protein
LQAGFQAAGKTPAAPAVDGGFDPSRKLAIRRDRQVTPDLHLDSHLMHPGPFGGPRRPERSALRERAIPSSFHIIFTGDRGYGDLGCHGLETAKTRNPVLKGGSTRGRGFEIESNLW